MRPNKNQIKKHLEIISRPRDAFDNPEVLSEVQKYIHNELCSYGYSVSEHTFEYNGQSFSNLIANHNSVNQTKLIIGAHFDSVPNTPGADDNASGIAGMLEAARCLKETEFVSHIDFLAFNLEEYGMVGSREYVKYLKNSKHDLLGMISLEMIGFTSEAKGSQKIPAFLRPFYSDTGNFVALVGDLNSKKLLKLAKRAFSNIDTLKSEYLTLPFKGKILPETRLSDHSPFWDAEIPALLVTDTSFFRNPHYHSTSDGIETLDLEFLLKICAATVNLGQTFLK